MATAKQEAIDYTTVYAVFKKAGQAAKLTLWEELRLTLLLASEDSPKYFPPQLPSCLS